MAAGLLAVSPAHAGACSEDEAQDLNSRIEAALTLAETSEGLDAAGQEKIVALRQELAEASKAQMQAQDSDDDAQMNEVCKTYEALLQQTESLSQ